MAKYLRILDNSMGTLPASHFHKVCTNRTCGCTQYYGYYTARGGAESSSEVFYNEWWESLPYFVSSCETAFSMSAMNCFTTEILLGQLSFKQCADIIISINGRDVQYSKNIKCKQLWVEVHVEPNHNWGMKL